MARVNVFLNDQLFDEINQQAKQEGSNHRALIQAAVKEYIVARRRTREENEEKRRKMEEACRKMDALAKKLGNWDPRATIRKFRDGNLKGAS